MKIFIPLLIIIILTLSACASSEVSSAPSSEPSSALSSEISSTPSSELSSVPAALSSVQSSEVSSVATSEQNESSVSGTVEDAAMNSLLLDADDGRQLWFSTTDADKSELSEMLIGTKITVYYSGDLPEKGGMDSPVVTAVKITDYKE